MDTNTDRRSIPINRLLVFNLILVLSCVGCVSGGMCWVRITKSKMCSKFFKSNVTREECCSNTRIPSAGWTPTEGQVFYWKVLAPPVPDCTQCHHSCDGIKCDLGRVCRMRKGIPKCVCRPECPNELRKRGPLCGTDSNDYKNYCHMLKRNCKKNRETEIAYFGKCKRTCKKVKCLTGTRCLEDQNGLPHCVRCQSKCPIVSNPRFVCGDNMVSYPSVCHIRAAICTKQTPIRIAYVGRCRENASCANTMCPEGYKCLVNRHTLQPMCENCRRRCSSSMSSVPVCGTDGVSYDSFCELFRTSCETGLSIRTNYSGRCNRDRKYNRTCKKCRRKRKRKHRRRLQRRFKTNVDYYKVNIYRPEELKEEIVKFHIFRDPDNLTSDIS